MIPISGLTVADMETIDWDKSDGLVPAIVQNADTRQVLMLGYMDREAFRATLGSGFATFYSRSRARLWKKGETSGNTLRVTDIARDCDNDALLVSAVPAGPVCHRGTQSCFGEYDAIFAFPGDLETIVAGRAKADPQTSYTARLMAAGIKRMAQKVGEEGVETALAATAGDRTETIAEAADLAFHLTVLLHAMDVGWSDVSAELARRHAAADPCAPHGTGS